MKYVGHDHGLDSSRVHYPQLDGIETLVTTGDKNESPFKLLMQRHIPEFFRVYQATKDKVADTEALQKIRKAFVSYK